MKRTSDSVPEKAGSVEVRLLKPLASAEAAKTRRERQEPDSQLHGSKSGELTPRTQSQEMITRPELLVVLPKLRLESVRGWDSSLISETANKAKANDAEFGGSSWLRGAAQTRRKAEIVKKARVLGSPKFHGTTLERSGISSPLPALHLLCLSSLFRQFSCPCCGMECR